MEDSPSEFCHLIVEQFWHFGWIGEPPRPSTPISRHMGSDRNSSFGRAQPAGFRRIRDTDAGAPARRLIKEAGGGLRFLLLLARFQAN